MPCDAAMLMCWPLSSSSIFYCLDALYGERRDRSILFWKSLPVSDLTTVLAKASIPLVVLPLIVFAITVATQLIMLLLSSLRPAGERLECRRRCGDTCRSSRCEPCCSTAWSVIALWYAPIYAWLLLISAWARRAAFLWAALPLARDLRRREDRVQHYAIRRHVGISLRGWTGGYPRSR